MKISEQIQDLRARIESLESGYVSKIDEIDNKLTSFSDELKIVSDNWAGNWTSHSNYYNNFIGKSREQYIQFTYDSLSEFINKKSELELSFLKNEMNSIAEKFKAVNEDLVTELSIIKSKEEFKNQLELYQKLIEFEWGIPAFQIIKSQKPKKLMTSYADAQRIFSKGLVTPPHFSLNAEILASATLGASIKEYIKFSKRLLREVELILNVETDDYIGNENPYSNLNRLFDKFHTVVRQLINRHAGRSTIEINDEYDVQDLLHSLLKIYFDDVRPEEYTPSYAGRNTRLDFLLKKERIVVEVKKTRESLKDREIGDELLQDIARYKNHPDCNTLFCFVYDPQGLIQNSSGLEDDLASESSEKLQVFVIIRP